MLGFSEFLSVNKKQYVCLHLCKTSCQYMKDWCQYYNFDISHSYDGDLIKPDEFGFHVTVFQTTNKVPLFQGILDIDPIQIEFDKFEYLGVDKNIPVLRVVKDDKLLAIRRKFEECGMKDEWPNWKPHVSVSYIKKRVYDADKVQLPNFPIYLDRLEMKAQTDE